MARVRTSGRLTLVGARNVNAAFLAAQGIELSAPAKLVLLRMANTSRDTDSPPRYWQGWEPLALSLNYTPAQLDPGAAGRDSARRHVRRLVKALVDAGLVQRVNELGEVISDGSDARTGHRQVYALTLWNRVLGGLSDPPAPDLSDPPAGGSGVSYVGDAMDPPKEEGGRDRGRGPGEPASVDLASHQARAGVDGDDEYAAAHKILEHAGPAATQQALDAVRTLHPEVTTRRAVILAAAHHTEAGAA